MAEVRIKDHALVVDSDLIARDLGIDKDQVQSLMHEGKITTLSEHGVDDDAGTHRLTFFYKACRARLIVDAEGHILRRSSIDFGDHATAAMIRRLHR
jgi:hypothetical protein